MKRPMNLLLSGMLIMLFLITIGAMGWSVKHVCFLLFFISMLALAIRVFHLLTHNKYNDAAEDA